MLHEQIFYAITTTLSLVLAVRTLHLLLSKWVKQYYLLIAILVLLILGVVPYISSHVQIGSWKLESAQKLYWGLAMCSQLATFTLLLQLIYRVGKEVPGQGMRVRMLTVIAVTAAAISFYVHSDQRMNSFMGSVARDLTFGSALINLVLWRFLLQIRKRDFIQLAVSAGIGIQCTGDAIGLSLRFLGKQIGETRTFLEFGNILMSLTAVLTLVIWHSAFVKARNRKESPPPAPRRPQPAPEPEPVRSELVGPRENH